MGVIQCQNRLNKINNFWELYYDVLDNNIISVKEGKRTPSK